MRRCDEEMEERTVWWHFILMSCYHDLPTTTTTTMNREIPED